MKRSVDMCNGPLFKNIVIYAVPLMLTGVLQLLFNAADLIVVGRFCGSLSVAAVGATGAIINLIVNLFIGLSVGAGVAAAHAIGARDDDALSDTVHTSMPTAFVSGVVLTVVGAVLARPLLEMMKTPADVIGLSTTYMRIYFYGITSAMVYNFGSAILRAAGDTKGPLIYLTIAGVVNVVLNVIFIVVFHLDVAGVALATSISQTLSAVLVVIALIRRSDGCRLILRKMRISKKPLMKIVQIGLPAGIQGSLFSISNVIIQSSVNSFGSVAVSGSSAASNIEGFTYMAMNALQQTALNFSGQNMGARKYDRIGKILAITLASVTVSGVVLGVLTFIFGEPLLGIYITDSPGAIQAGMVRITCIGLAFFLGGAMDVVTGVIRGMGASVGPMIITILGVCGVRIVWLYTVFKIPEYHTLSCIFLSYPISWFITLAAEIVFFICISSKLKKRAELSEY